MKIPEGTRNILTVCTGGKDRSPIMAEYFRGLGYEAKAVGISAYHTGENRTQWCSREDVGEADLIVVVSTVHEAFIRGLIRGVWNGNYNPHIRIVDLADHPGPDDPNFRELVLTKMRGAFEK